MYAINPIAGLLDGTAGNFILTLYIIGGIALMVTALLPGNSTGWRVGGSVLGIGLAAWAGYVLLFGGWILVSFYVLLLPIFAAYKGVMAMLKSRQQPPASPPGGYPGGPPPHRGASQAGPPRWGSQAAPPPQSSPPQWGTPR